MEPFDSESRRASQSDDQRHTAAPIDSPSSAPDAASSGAERLLHAFIVRTIGKPLAEILPANGKTSEDPAAPTVMSALLFDRYFGWFALIPLRLREPLLKETSEWNEAMALSPDGRSQVVRTAIGVLRSLQSGRFAVLAEVGGARPELRHADTLRANAQAFRVVSCLLAALLKGKLKSTDADLTELVLLAADRTPGSGLLIPAVPIVVALEKFCAANVPSEALCEAC